MIKNSELKMVAMIIAVSIAQAISGCGSSGGTSNTSNGTADLSETANLATAQVVTATQALDPVVYASYRDNLQKNLYKNIAEFLIPSAYAISCSSGGSSVSACSSASPYTIVRSYNNSCTIGSGSLALLGSTTYTYSSPLCSIVGFDKTVTRTTNITLSGKKAGTVAITSDNVVDYRGNNIGGGQKLTVNSTSGFYTLDVLGENRSMVSPAGTSVWNLSSRTTAPITVNGSSATGIVLSSSGGALEVIHNNAKYVLALSVNNLTFNNTCNCPVSGSMTGTYSGSVQGTATITYSGCGTATISTSNGESQTVAVDICSAL